MTWIYNKSFKSKSNCGWEFVSSINNLSTFIFFDFSFIFNNESTIFNFWKLNFSIRIYKLRLRSLFCTSISRICLSRCTVICKIIYFDCFCNNLTSFFCFTKFNFGGSICILFNCNNFRHC